MKARLILLLLCLGMFCFLQSSFIGYAQNGENIPQEPQTITPSSKQMQTLEEKLDLILEQYSELKATDKELEQEVKEAFRDNTSYISLGMTTLGVFAGALALIGIFITVMTYFNSKNHLREIKEVRDKAVKYDSDLEQVFLKQPMSEKIDKSVLKEAKEKVRDITADGRDTLLALAIKAQENEELEDAYSFWKALTKVEKNDKVLFYYALSAMKFFDKLDDNSNIFLLDEALNAFSSIKNVNSNSSILGMWGLLCAKIADVANQQVDKEFYWAEAEKKYAEAINLNQNNTAVLSNWGVLLTKRAESTTDIEIKMKLQELASSKYAIAARVNPSELETWVNWCSLFLDKVSIEKNIEKRNELLLQAEEKISFALHLGPNRVEPLVNLGVIRLHQASNENAEKRVLLWGEAEMFFLRALDLNPESKDTYFNLACLEALRGRVDICLQYLAQCKSLGYPNLKEAIMVTSDFKDVRSKPELEAFLGSISG